MTRHFIGLSPICICGLVDMHENAINKIMKERGLKRNLCYWPFN